MQVLKVIAIVLLTLAAAHAYERAWPHLFPDPLGPWPDAGFVHGCAPSPWQRVTFVCGGAEQTIYLSCTERRDEILAWPSFDGGVGDSLGR